MFKDLQKGLSSAVTSTIYLTAVLAVVFDLGYFGAIEINLLTLFSLSEHVLFSMEAVPNAIAILLGTAGLFFIVRRITAQSAFRANENGRSWYLVFRPKQENCAIPQMG